MFDKMGDRLVPEYPYVPTMCDGLRLFIHMQPEGSCLAIGAWNYPIFLLRAPFLGVVAVGYTDIMKPR